MAPVAAVMQEEGVAYVFKVLDNRLQRVPVNVGIRHGEVYVISGDINHADIIVSRDVAALSDGQIISQQQ